MKNAKLEKVTEERSSYQFANGTFGVDENGKLVHLFIYISEQKLPSLPPISIKATDGSDFLSLTKGQFLSLYGNPNRPGGKDELRERSFRYEYKSGSDRFITLVVIFKGKADNSKMVSVSGSCIYGKLAEQVFQMSPGVKYLAWPG